MPQHIRQDPNDPSKFNIEKKTNFWYDFDKNVPDLIEIYKKYDVPVAVLGSGPSLPEDLKKIPDNCILISCNHHAFELLEPDYMVFLDPLSNNHSQRYRDRVANPGKAKRISYGNLNETDYYCINEATIYHKLSDTGIFGAWIGCYITTGKVYLCGMGLRVQNEQMHFYDNPDFKNNVAWGGPSLQNKLDKWAKLEPFKDQLVAVSGPLKELFS